MGILPYTLCALNLAKMCCTTTSILHATLDIFLTFIWPSFVPTVRGETAIEKHLRLHKQADEFAWKNDFYACVHVLCTRDLAVTQVKWLFESRGWRTPAFQKLMESSKQSRIKNENDDDEYSESTVDSTLQCKSHAAKEGTERSWARTPSTHRKPRSPRSLTRL